MVKLTQEELHKKWENKYKIPENYYITVSDNKRYERMEKDSYRPFIPKNHYIPMSGNRP